MTQCGRGGTVDTTDLFGAALEKFSVAHTLKFRETLTRNGDGNPDPSHGNVEGAETRREWPKSSEDDMVEV